jgi:beta-phosphoglucomutase
MINQDYENLKFDAVLFDLDGVIIKSMEQHLEAWQYAFSNFGARITAEDFYDLEGRGVRVVSEILAKKFKIPLNRAPEIRRRKNAYYDRIAKIEYYEGLFPLLIDLKENDKKLAIITGSIKKRVQKLINGRLNGFFSAIVTSEDVEHTKPFPEPFLKGAELLKVPPQNCIVIENAPLGIEAAKRAGMMVFAVTSTVPVEQLRNADYIFPSLIEIHEKIKAIIEEE